MTLTLPRPPRRRLAATASALAFLPFAAAGCGSDDEGSSSASKGPASVAPAGALFYADITVPQGQQRSDIDALIGKVAPGQSLDKLLSMAKSGNTSFDEDVKPWLGDKAGVAITGVTGDEPEFVVALDSKDDKKAKALFVKGSKKLAAYKDVDLYQDADDPTAYAGFLPGEVLIGTQSAVKAGIDTAKGAPSITTAPNYGKLRAQAGDDGLAFFYGDIGKLLGVAQQSGLSGDDQAGFDAIREFASKQGVSAFAADMSVAADKVAVSSLAVSKAQPGEGDAAPAVAALPAGALAAFGIGDLGAAFTQVLDLTRSVTTTTAGAPSPGAQLDEGLRQIKSATGLDVEQDLLSWMGSAGLFLRGTSITDAGGALVVKTKDPAKTKAALSKLTPLLRQAGLSPSPLSGSGIDDGFSVQPNGLPVQVLAALSGDKFVVAANQAALDAALQPSSTLGDDPAFKAAAAQLSDGVAPSFFLDFKSIAALAGLAAGNVPQFQLVKPYLDSITTVVSGSKREGDVLRQDVAIGVR